MSSFGSLALPHAVVTQAQGGIIGQRYDHHGHRLPRWREAVVADAGGSRLMPPLPATTSPLAVASSMAIGAWRTETTAWPSPHVTSLPS